MPDIQWLRNSKSSLMQVKWCLLSFETWKLLIFAIIVRSMNCEQCQLFEVLLHPAYSPDWDPSDYHLFGQLKSAFHGIVSK